jgi:hypothetical protein
LGVIKIPRRVVPPSQTDQQAAEACTILIIMGQLVVPVNEAIAQWSQRWCLDKSGNARFKTSSVVGVSEGVSHFQATNNITGEILYIIKRSSVNPTRYLLLDAQGHHLAILETNLGCSKIYTYMPNYEFQRAERSIKELSKDSYFLGEVKACIGGRMYCVVPTLGGIEMREVAKIELQKDDDRRDDKFVVTTSSGKQQRQGRLEIIKIRSYSKLKEHAEDTPVMDVAAGMDVATAVLLYFSVFALRHRRTAADDEWGAACGTLSSCKIL